MCVRGEAAELWGGREQGVMGYLLVPVSEGHHDVERSQQEAEVEEGVAVGHAVLFVVHGAVDSVLP